ncbi:MAG: hypothetical protein LUD72_10260 [Bacteroidales bacterium]|nr:hypothetical protein [Bacteroidales bacterium]
MEEKKLRPKAVIDNQQYKDRFQFVLSINDHIICQRYFKVNGFNPDSLESEELKDAIDEAVDLIKADLVSKSRVYLWYVGDRFIKMTGFDDKDPTVGWFDPTPFEDPNKEDPYLEKTRPSDGEFMFRFTFLVDEKVRYEHQWDGNVYPKYVRNKVDLTNSDSQWRGKDPSTLGFDATVNRAMTAGKVDLTYHIIKKLCDILSNPINEKGEAIAREYTKSDDYGDKTYYYSVKDRQFVNSWRTALSEKTRRHMAYATNYISDKLYDKLERHA